MEKRTTAVAIKLTIDEVTIVHQLITNL